MKKFNLVYFGASCDPLEKNKQFAEKLELDYPLLSDTDTKVAEAYGILKGKRARRTTFYIDMDGKIAHIESKVDVRTHGNQIVEQLKQLNVPLKKEDDGQKKDQQEK